MNMSNHKVHNYFLGGAVMMQQRKYSVRGLVKFEDIPQICEHVSLDFVDFHLAMTKKDKKEDRQIQEGFRKEHSSRYMKYRELKVVGSNLEHMKKLYEQVKPYLFKDYTHL